VVITPLNSNMKYFLAIITLSVINGCGFLLVKIGGLDNNKVSISKLSNQKIELICIPMHHVGTIIFYNNVKQIIDSLVSRGYYCYYEGAERKHNDSLIRDTYTKKLRYLISSSFGKGNYYDSSTKMFSNGVWYKGNLNLIPQPKSNYFFDPSNSSMADYPLDLLVNEYESKFGEIILDSCNLNTTLKSECNCTLAPKESKLLFSRNYIHEFRNNIIVDSITNNNRKKIVLVYGENHIEEVSELLKLKDKNWRKIE
jgi:hypothetical protein